MCYNFVLCAQNFNGTGDAKLPVPPVLCNCEASTLHDTDRLKCMKRLVNLLAAPQLRFNEGQIFYGTLKRSKDLSIYLIY